MNTDQRKPLWTSLLVPVDGSPQAAGALSLACEIARSEGARMVLCTALELPGVETQFAMAGYSDPGLIDRLTVQAETILNEAMSRGLAAGITHVETFLREENPVQAILTLAKDQSVDLIVMGSHGRTGLQRLLLGSTTEGVIRQSPVPVLVVRHPDGIPETVHDDERAHAKAAQPAPA